jgi:hypothetical protein
MGAGIMPILAVGQAVLGVVSGFAQISMARKQAQAQQDAATQQLKLSYKEISRQQEQVNETAQKQESDRVRAANAELGTMRVATAERGVSGTTVTAFARTIGFLEGVDLARIERNREANIEAGEFGKESALAGYHNSITIAQNQAQVSMVTAGLGMVGSGLNIAGNYYKDQQALQSKRNQIG